MKLRAHTFVCALALLPGCDRGDTRAPVDAPQPAIARCSEGESFPSLAFVPTDTRRLLWIRLDDPTFDASAKRLSEFARTNDPRMPIVAGMELAQFDLQLALVRDSLARVGHKPAEILELRGPTDERAFVWPSTCDLDSTMARMREAWGISFRSAIAGRIGTAPAGGFPFDIVLLAGDRIALVPHGAGGKVAPWLADEGHGEIAGTLAALSPAPIRGVLVPHGLVGTGDAGASSPQFDLVQIRADSDRVAIDVSLRTPDAGRTP